MARNPAERKRAPKKEAAKEEAQAEVNLGVTADICSKAGEVIGSCTVKGGKVVIKSTLPSSDVHKNSRDLTWGVSRAIIACFADGRDEFAG